MRTLHMVCAFTNLCDILNGKHMPFISFSHICFENAGPCANITLCTGSFQHFFSLKIVLNHIGYPPKFYLNM